MTALIRADWLRLGRRRDVWLALALVAILAILSYVSGLANASTSVEISPDIPAEGNDVQEVVLRQYAFPQSLLTVLAGGQAWTLIMLAYLAAATTGAEFSYATIRTTLTVRADRRGFLLMRFAALALMAAVMLVILLVVGVAMPAASTALGAPLPEAPVISVPGLVSVVGALYLFGTVVIALTVACVLVVRNAAMALVIVVAYSVLETAVASFAERGGQAVADAARLLPFSDAALLIQRAQLAAGMAQLPAREISAEGPPTALAIAVGVAWLLALSWGCLRFFQRADITE